MNKQKEIKLEDFTKLVKWYEYSQTLKRKITEKLINTIEKEFYLVDKEYIKNFRNIFKYEAFKKMYPQNYGRPLNENEIKKYYEDNKMKFGLIPAENTKALKSFKNDKIIKSNKKVEPNYSFKNYYDNFVILDKNIFEELTKDWYIEQKIKVNLYLGDRIFIITLPNDIDIEVGIFDQIYNYKNIFLIHFADKKEFEEEIEKIKRNGLDNYFFLYKLKTEKIIGEIIKKTNGKELIIINLNKYKQENLLFKDESSINENINELDISHKKGLINFDGKSSKLNSIIQLLTSIKEIKNNIEKNNEIEIYTQIYILSSTLKTIIKELYDKNRNNKSSLETLKYIIDFIDPEISQKKIKDYLLFILNALHGELNEIANMQNSIINLESFNSPFSNEIYSLSEFNKYYSENYKSVISKNFNFIRKEIVQCSNCNNQLFSFKSLPFLVFDLDKVHKFMLTNQVEYKQIQIKCGGNDECLKREKEKFLKTKENQQIHLQNCFEYYLKNGESDFNKDKNTIITKCSNCNSQNPNFFSRIRFHSSPNYFIFILDREKKIRIVFPEIFQLDTYLDEELKYKKYKLMGVLNIEENSEFEKHYVAILRNKDEKWIKFDNEYVLPAKEEEIYNPVQSRLLLYKGVNY